MAGIKISKLIEEFPDDFNNLIGNPAAEFSDVCSETTLVSGGLLFSQATSNAALANLFKLCSGKKAFLVLSSKNKDLEGDFPDKSLYPEGILFSDNPYLAMAKTVQKYFAIEEPAQNQFLPADKFEADWHPTAQISVGAKIGRNVKIGAYTSIETGCEIGDNSVIKQNVVISYGAGVGAFSQIHPHVHIGHDCFLGEKNVVQSMTVIGSEGFGYAHDKNGKHYHIPHRGRVIIGDRVEIGASTTIDRGTFEDTVIGPDTIIDNKVHIAHNCQFGKNTILTGGFMTAGSVVAGDGFIAGARTGITGHLKIVAGVTTGANSIVRGDITKPGVYAGEPVVPMATYRRNLVAGTQLAEMKKNIDRLVKAVFKS